jgi:hypothetical protein
MDNNERFPEREKLKIMEQELAQKISVMEADGGTGKKLDELHAQHERILEQLSKYDHSDLESAA